MGQGAGLVDTLRQFEAAVAFEISLASASLDLLRGFSEHSASSFIFQSSDDNDDL
jgi:hypothetical protein